MGIFYTSQHTEASHSGLVHRLGKAACRKASRVRISPPPNLYTSSSRREWGARYHYHNMMEVTFWPILAAGVASVLIGWVWYHPSIFGGSWMRMGGMTPEMAERGKKWMPLYALVALLASMLVAYVMNYFGIAWGVYDWIGAIELGFWCWIGFTAPPMLGMVLWEQKPIRYYLIVSLYWLVSFIVMAIILVVGSAAVGANYDMEADQTGAYLAE